MREQIKIYRMVESAKMPFKGTRSSSCYDICYCPDAAPEGFITAYSHNNVKIKEKAREGFYLHPRTRYLIPTGLKSDISSGWDLRIHPRSGSSLKMGLKLNNQEGVIDEDYKNQIFVSIYNGSDERVLINAGSVIAQIEAYKKPEYEFIETDIEPTVTADNERKGGFGHTSDSDKIDV